MTVNAMIYADPMELPWVMRMYPPLAFSRIIYNLSIACSYGSCYKHISSLSQEIYSCIAFLYLGFVVLLALGKQAIVFNE